MLVSYYGTQYVRKQGVLCYARQTLASYGVQYVENKMCYAMRVRCLSPTVIEIEKWQTRHKRRWTRYRRRDTTHVKTPKLK